MVAADRLVERLSPADWARQNLFRTRLDSAVTIVAGGLLLFAAFSLLRWVVVGADWEIIRVNLSGFITGNFPEDQMWRLVVAVLLALAVAGLLAGVADTRRGSGRRGLSSTQDVVKRIWPVIVFLIILLALTRTMGPTLLAIGGVASLVVARMVGRRLPARAGRLVTIITLVTPVLVVAIIAAFGGVGWDKWGGLPLTLFLAAAGIVLSFPLGVLLALGRRSSFPVARYLSIAYIEFFRGVPLISLLFMAFLMLALFLPQGAATPGNVMRAIVAITLFTAAYIAEIVRGGLQSVPSGQIEASQALGMSPVRTTFFIVLPQALRAVIPAIVGQFISLFKDTALVSILGLTEVLGLAQTVTQQADFRGQGRITETLLFAAVIYWVGSYTMSKESQSLEKRLGVGER